MYVHAYMYMQPHVQACIHIHACLPYSHIKTISRENGICFKFFSENFGFVLYTDFKKMALFFIKSYYVLGKSCFFTLSILCMIQY